MRARLRKILHFLKTKRTFQIYILIFLLAMGAFFRFYNYPYRYGLGEETVRDAVVGIQGVRQMQLPLTGPFSSVGPFTFGPLYWYQTAFAYFIGRFDYSPWVYLSLASVCYILVFYKIGELLEGKNFGLLLAFFASISPVQIISATHLTSHNLTNVYAGLAFLLFLCFIKRNMSYWWSFIWGIVIGVGISLHYQMSGLLTLPGILLLFKPKKYIYFITCMVGLFVTALPMIFFELNNHWFNVRNMLYFYTQGKDAIYVPNRWLFYVRDFWPSFWGDALGVPSVLGGVFMLTFFGFILYFSWKRKLKMPMVLLLVAFGIEFILLRYYWGEKLFGYLNFLRPFVYIFTGYVFFYITKFRYGIYISGLLLLFFAGIVLPQSVERFGKDSLSMEMYRRFDLLENAYPKQKFTLYTCGKKYSGGYNAEVYALLFILDDQKKLDEKGMKIGVVNDCSLTDEAVNTADRILPISYPQIEGAKLVDLSGQSKEKLLKQGWNTVSFQGMYDSYARWWFKEAP